jgi:hypothetical protein
MPPKAARAQHGRSNSVSTSASSTRAASAAAAATTTGTTVGALPDELLLHVFTFVDSETLITSVPGVCRRWRSLCGDTPAVLLDLSFLKDGAPLVVHRNVSTAVRMVLALARRWKHVVKIRLGVLTCSDIIVTAVASCCAQTAEFVVTDCSPHDENEGSVTDVGLVSLAMHCPRLVHVDLPGFRLTVAGVATLAEQCSQLKSVRLVGGVSDAGVLSIAKHCHMLTAADFRQCNISNTAVVALAEGCPLLTSVNFSYNTILTDAALTALSQKCPLLTSVDFCSCDRLTDVGVCALAQHCTQLVVVDFFFCNLTSAAVIALAQGCPHLSKATFSYCQALTNDAVSALVEHCTRLTVADFSYCPQITSGAIVALALFVPKNCPLLTSIDLRQCRIEADAAAILRKHIPQLTLLT